MCFFAVLALLQQVVQHWRLWGFNLGHMGGVGRAVSDSFWI